MTTLQAHEIQFPILARIARDYLAIPGSSVPLERAFSSMRHIGMDFRNALSPRMFEALQILKDGYKHGIISASAETEQVLWAGTAACLPNELQAVAPAV